MDNSVINDITVRRPIQWLCASATNVGTVRTINEDAVLDRSDIGLWAVADGMGGHEAGDVASQMIIDSLGELQKPDTLSDFVDAIESRIFDVNQRLFEYAEIMLDGRHIGSTFITLVVYGQVGFCMWMGDSRLYLFRSNDLLQLSRDHSQVSELLQSGVITEAEAINHPEANVITRAVGSGIESYIDLDVFGVQLGDVYLLCSDGLYNAVSKQTICDCLSKADPQDMVDALIDSALANGASDNVSVIAIKGTRRLQQAGLQVNKLNNNER